MNKFSIKKLSNTQKELRKRILEISYESHLSHIGSCLTSVDLIDAIYLEKRKSEKFILSNGHAGIAWYVILEKYGFIKDSKIIKRLNIHPDRNVNIGIPVSTGSLGQGLPIALGIAISNPKKNVYCMISDGECAEGSIWESLNVASEKEIYNLKIIINANGWSAYDKVNLKRLTKKLNAFGFKILEIDGHDSGKISESLKIMNEKKSYILFAYTTVEQLPFLKGQDAHYYVMTQNDYEISQQLLK